MQYFVLTCLRIYISTLILCINVLMYMRKQKRINDKKFKRKNDFNKQVKIKLDKGTKVWKFEETPQYPFFRCIARNEDNAVRKYRNFIIDCNTARREGQSIVRFLDIDGKTVKKIILPVINNN